MTIDEKTQTKRVSETLVGELYKALVASEEQNVRLISRVDFLEAKVADLKDDHGRLLELLRLEGKVRR